MDGTPISIKGQEFELRWDFNALLALSRRGGIPIEQLDAIWKEDTALLDRLELVRAFLWSGLLHQQDATWTLEAAGRLLTGENILERTTEIAQAFNAQLPKVLGISLNGEATTTTAGAGTSSNASPTAA